jgi:hypothetical protein
MSLVAVYFFGDVRTVQTPSNLSPVLKFYIDWDGRAKELQGCAYVRGAATIEAQVQRWRELALQTPAVICQMLREELQCVPRDVQDIFVLVKEGTRPILQAGASAADGAKDWKISFHFIFQIQTSMAQMACIYNHICKSIERLDKVGAASSYCAPC